MTSIPGAEYAPIVALNFFARPSAGPPDEEALDAFLVHEGYAPGEPLHWRTGIDRALHILPHPITIRRLSVSDPDDQRAIWRLAALTFGLSEDESCGALLYPRWTLDADACHQWLDEWILCHPATHTDKSAPLPRFWRLYAVDGAPVLNATDVRAATAALCRAVWGPR